MSDAMWKCLGCDFVNTASAEHPCGRCGASPPERDKLDAVPYIRTILKIPLGRRFELHAIRPNNSDPILISLVDVSDDDWAIRIRPTIKIPQSAAMRLGKFLCGVVDIPGVETERVEREVTKPGR